MKTIFCDQLLKDVSKQITNNHTAFQYGINWNLYPIYSSTTCRHKVCCLITFYLKLLPSVSKIILARLKSQFWRKNAIFFSWTADISVFPFEDFLKIQVHHEVLLVQESNNKNHSRSYPRQPSAFCHVVKHLYGLTTILRKSCVYCNWKPKGLLRGKNHCSEFLASMLV